MIWTQFLKICRRSTLYPGFGFWSTGDSCGTRAERCRRGKTHPSQRAPQCSGQNSTPSRSKIGLRQVWIPEHSVVYLNGVSVVRWSQNLHTIVRTTYTLPDCRAQNASASELRVRECGTSPCGSTTQCHSIQVQEAVNFMCFCPCSFCHTIT